MLQFQSAYSKLFPSDVKFPKCFINKVKSSSKLDSSSDKKQKNKTVAGNVIGSFGLSSDLFPMGTSAM